MVELLPWALRDAAAGYYPARAAVEMLRVLFVSAFGGEDDRITKEQAASEFEGILAWAVGQVAEIDPAAIREAAEKPLAANAAARDDFSGIWTPPVAVEPPSVDTASAMGRSVALVTADDIEDDVPDWVWTVDGVGRIQQAVLNLFAGRPGAGKSTAARWYAAQWTLGALEGIWHGQPQNVAYIASEESLKYVVKPGLRAAGADMKRIFFPKVTFNGEEAPLIADEDEKRLTAQLLAAGVTVVIVDPVMATIEKKTDIYRNNELRAALAPWTRIAETINGTVTGVVHLKKGTNSDVVGAINGSSGFGEVARCVFGFVKNPESDDGERIMSQVKNSCGPEDLSRSYRIVGTEVKTDSGRTGTLPLFVMGDDSETSVDDDPRRRHERRHGSGVGRHATSR